MLVGDRDSHLAPGELAIDRDPLQQGDRLLDAILDHPDFAIGRASAVAGEIDRNRLVPRGLGQAHAGDARFGLEIAEPDDDRNGDTVDRGQAKADALALRR